MVRKPERFEGTVFYQLVTYGTGPDGTPVPRKTEPFEMRTAKRKVSTPAAERDVRIPLTRQVTHVRFRIEAAFDGTLEIEQPQLTGDAKRTRK